MDLHTNKEWVIERKKILAYNLIWDEELLSLL